MSLQLSPENKAKLSKYVQEAVGYLQQIESLNEDLKNLADIAKEEMEPKVEISESTYRELLERDNFLSALEAAGVDNWDGYAYAQELVDQWNNEHN